MMNFHMSFIYLVALMSAVSGFPRNAIDFFPKPLTRDLESSGGGPDEPIRGTVKVVQISPNFLRRTSSFGRATPPRDMSSNRGAFPAFLALGRPGQSTMAKRPLPPVPQLRESHHGVDVKQKQGLQMWQRVIQKSDLGKEAVALPGSPKDMNKDSCAAVPFTQRVSAEGCEAVTILNKLCFGQCSSMFVPSAGEPTGRHGAPCSRCGPSRARTLTVPLLCGTDVREKRVMVVEECKCETGREKDRVETRAATHL